MENFTVDALSLNFVVRAYDLGRGATYFVLQFRNWTTYFVVPKWNICVPTTSDNKDYVNFQNPRRGMQ